MRGDRYLGPLGKSGNDFLFGLGVFSEIVSMTELLLVNHICTMPDTPGKGLFTIPAPIKRLFDKFPLTTYPANEIPQRSQSNDAANQLFVFADARGAREGRPSFNPQCLKWQVGSFISSIAPYKIWQNCANCLGLGILEVRRNRLRSHLLQ